MYQELHRWEDAIAVAAARVRERRGRGGISTTHIVSHLSPPPPQSHPDLNSLKSSHFQFLLDSGQEERAGEVREKEGDLAAAVTFYMKAGLPGKAAKLISQHQVSHWRPV